MAKLVVLLIVLALVVVGVFTLGLPQTITLLALAGTAAVFYVMIHISLT